MSDTLNKRISTLERRLKREKLARKEAEKLLEEKSKSIFENKLDLERQVAEAKQKQKQLSFLTGLSSEIGGAVSIDAVVKIFLYKSHVFLNKANASFVQVNFETDSYSIKPFDFGKTDSSKPLLPDTFINNKANIDKLVLCLVEAKYESQLLAVSDLTGNSGDSGFCFAVPIMNLKKQLGMALFYYEASEQLDIFKLQTMESARVSLESAIQQKLTALKLASRYQELKKTHIQLNQTQLQLVQSEKMASLGELAAGVAHEINNPIGYVLSNYETLNEYMNVMLKLLEINSEILAESGADKQWLESISSLWQEEDIEFIKNDVGQLVNASKEGLKRVQEIVAGLKVFSHTNSADSVATSLSDCIDDSLQLVSNELKYHCKIDKNISICPPIFGRSNALQQVFVNMFINAKQAMPEGGTITVKLKEDGKFQQLSISDQGCGIKQSDISKLFTPFFTTKPVGVGTGLGLSISYGILQDHDATIDVQSEVGKGTTFIMRFPTMG